MITLYRIDGPLAGTCREIKAATPPPMIITSMSCVYKLYSRTRKPSQTEFEYTYAGEAKTKGGG